MNSLQMIGELISKVKEKIDIMRNLYIEKEELLIENSDIMKN